MRDDGGIPDVQPLTQAGDSPRAGPAAAPHRYSPLSRKIVTFNLVALCLMMTGILYMSQFDKGLFNVRETSMEVDARLVSEALTMAVSPITDGQTLTAEAREAFLHFAGQMSTHLQLYDANGDLIAHSDIPQGGVDTAPAAPDPGFADRIVNSLKGLVVYTPPATPNLEQRRLYASATLQSALGGKLRRIRLSDPDGNILLSLALPVVAEGKVAGAIVLMTEPGEIDGLIRAQRSRVLQIFFLAMLISVILSIALANTIARPLKLLAEAAERGGASNARRVNPERIEIPDLTDRPDEIGYLAGALKSMTTALYDRIDANESFAADVAHEIKNPLTSLRSAVDTLKYAKDDAAQAKLLGVIQHDVLRLDRLVTDISNASRLDSELVRDEMAEFDMNMLLTSLVEYNREMAEKGDVTLEIEIPDAPLMVHGLEGRLAQVFVNLITNAISFTEQGGTITVTARPVGDQVEVRVEDTGPGIPDANLGDVFSRFYSERPGQDYGNHSGLGLAISKQIVDAHSGRIWAENIRAPGAGEDTAPTGARFSVMLPA